MVDICHVNTPYIYYSSTLKMIKAVFSLVGLNDILLAILYFWELV